MTETAQEIADDSAEEWVLVSRCQRGETRAFEDLVLRYRERIRNTVASYLKDRGDVEEVTADTFIRAHRALVRFRGDSSLATWLHRIAVNLARNRYWHRRRRKLDELLSLEMPLGEESDDTLQSVIPDTNGISAVTELMSREFESHVNHALRLIDPKHREIIEMRWLRHMAYEDIANQLELNVGTVKSRLARARSSLLEHLRLRCPELKESEAADWLKV